VLEDGAARVGEPGRARRAIEERHVELRLELRHRPGHGGLCAAQAAGRGREAALLEDGRQDLELIERDGAAISDEARVELVGRAQSTEVLVFDLA
jgi:hypothetical protein